MKYFLITLIIISIISCRSKESISFVQENTVEKTEIILNQNNTFLYKARALQTKKAVDFIQEGTFILQDSLLILDFTYDSYTYECYEIPLPNDTFLVSTFNNTVFLFKLHSFYKERSKPFTYNEMLNSLIELYKRNLIISKQYSEFLSCSQEDFENNFFDRNYIISEYYDKFLPKDVIKE